MTKETDMGSDMQYDEFEQLVSAYGGHAQNWPHGRRAAMLACAAANPKANALLAREASLDGWLDARLPDAPSALADTIISQIGAALPDTNNAAGDINIAKGETHTATGDTHAPLAFSRRAYGAALSALAACFIFGFVLAPVLLDTLSMDGALFASLDILSTSFLPTEPL